MAANLEGRNLKRKQRLRAREGVEQEPKRELGLRAEGFRRERKNLESKEEAIGRNGGCRGRRRENLVTAERRVLKS